MTSHTPGPWLYRPHKHDDWGFVRAPAVGQPGPLVACARSGQYHCDEDFNEHRRNGTDPYEANARLIAAAPELYEALKALERQALQSSVNDPANEWGREALEMARDAIVKATSPELGRNST